MFVPTWTTWVAAGPLALLFTIFAVKHVLADFTFQTQWMVYGKDRRAGWLLPLVTHCLVHAAGTLAIVIVARPRLWMLALADFAIHFGIDRGKAVINRRFELTPKDRHFWLLLGTDQSLHHLTGFLLALLLVAGR